MIKLRFSVLLLIFLFSTGLHSQVPGFLGKRLSINIGAGFYPALEGPTKNNKGSVESILSENPTKNTIGLNSAFEISADYAIGRYNSIGIYANQFQTGLTTRLHIPSGTSIFLVFDAETFHILNARTYGIVYSKFKSGKGALAPIGRFTSYGIERVNVKGEISDFIVINQKGITTVDPAYVQNFEQEQNIINFVFKYMISIPLTDRVLIKPGGSLRLPLNLLIQNFEFGDRSIHEDWGFNFNQAYYTTDMESRIFLHSLVRFEVNLAYLLF